MVESTKIIIVYAAVIIGMPLLFARIFWFIPGVILAKATSLVVTGLDQILNRIVEGFIAILITCIAFDQLSIQIAAGVPVILIIVNSLWDWSKESPDRAWSSGVGIIGGFMLRHQVILLLTDEFGLFL